MSNRLNSKIWIIEIRSDWKYWNIKTGKKGSKKGYKSDIFKENVLNNRMSHAYKQYKQRFGPTNPIFLGSAGLYFLSLFFDHPVGLCEFDTP